MRRPERPHQGEIAGEDAPGRARREDGPLSRQRGRRTSRERSYENVRKGGAIVSKSDWPPLLFLLSLGRKLEEEVL